MNQRQVRKYKKRLILLLLENAMCLLDEEGKNIMREYYASHLR